MSQTARAFLDVERSFSDRRWTPGRGDALLAEAISQRHGLSSILGEVLVNRGIGPDECQAYLEPRLKDLLPDPSGFRDMDVAAAIIARHIIDDRPMAVFGDYDVDGATSSALLIRYMSAVGGRMVPYIPDRMAEGYGPNLPALQKLADDGHELIITVDCGTTAFEVLDAAADLNIRVVVVDHHLAETGCPPWMRWSIQTGWTAPADMGISPQLVSPSSCSSR